MTPTTQSVVVPVEPTPEMIAAWYRVKNGHHFHDEPAPTDTSDYAAYRAMLAAAPAPSSLAGGEVLSAGERAFTAWGATSGADGTSLMWTWGEMPASQQERWAKIALAALSPEAPAREGVVFDLPSVDPVRRLKDLAEALALFAKHGGNVVNQRDAAILSDDLFAALTPRHEAPVVYGKGDVPLSVGDRVRVHTGEEGVIHQFLAGQTKCVNVLIRPGHGGSFFGFECEKVEAPAEGAGEDSPITAAIRAKLATVKATDYHPGTPAERMKEGKLDGLNTALAIAMVEDERAIRARSSAPEAREGELAGYANAEFMRRLKNWREAVPNTIRSDETFLKAVASESYPLALYTHPAAPSADKLREARQDVIYQMADGIEKLNLTPAKRELVKAAFRTCIKALSTPDALKGDAK